MTTTELDLDTPFELDIKPAPKVERPNKRLKIVGSNTYEYELFKLVDEYDPILKQPAEFFNFDNPVMKPAYLALSLVETMRHRYGIGLAAPQVGLSTRVFAVGGDSRSGIAYIMFNPIVIDSKGEVKMEEGCLSYPGLFLPIKRAEEVTVAYHDLEGNEQEKTFTGLTARVVLHELDHLDGVCFTSLVPRITLDRCKGKVKKNIKLLKVQREKNKKDEFIAEAMKNLYLEGLKQKYPDNPDPAAIIPTT